MIGQFEAVLDPMDRGRIEFDHMHPAGTGSQQGRFTVPCQAVPQANRGVGVRFVKEREHEPACLG